MLREWWMNFRLDHGLFISGWYSLLVPTSEMTDHKSSMCDHKDCGQLSTDVLLIVDKRNRARVSYDLCSIHAEKMVEQLQMKPMRDENECTTEDNSKSSN